MKNGIKNIIRFLAKERVLLSVYILVTLAASVQQYLLKGQPVGADQVVYTHYNNYVIFKYSFFHLLQNQNLYSLHLTEQWDLFKYSPTFALFMGLFAYLPDWLGLFLWNLLNSLVLFFGLKNLPGITPSNTVKMRWFVLQELLTSIQNAQSNGLILGLIVWGFIYLERKQLAWAALLMLLSTFIKIFGILGFILFIFYPQKPKAILYAVLWSVVLVALPLLAVTSDALIQQYSNWLVMLQNDHSDSIGLSVMGWLSTWFGLNPPKMAVVVVGAVLLMLPLLRLTKYSSYYYRLFMLAAVLLWIVIFNHKAESPTFIVAMGGVAIWYFSHPTTRLDTILVILAFIFTSLSPTDLFPAFLRQTVIIPYTLKAVFGIIIWAKIIVDMLTKEFSHTDSERVLSVG